MLSAGGWEGGDHTLVVIHVGQKTPVSTFKRAPSWNYKNADWDSFKQFAEEKCRGLQLCGENMNQNSIRFNDTILRATKRSIPRARRRNYNPFWAPQQEQLQENMESNPSDQSTAEYSKARADFTREKLLQARK